MACSYNNVLRQSALRLNALTGSTAADLQTAYTTSPLTTSQFESADFPFTSFIDACLLVEEKLAVAIADTGGHPWRAYLKGVTSSLAHKAAIPSLTSANKPIIGLLGSVYDASDGTVCTEMSLDDIRIAVRNAGSWLVTPQYGYKLDDHRIYHTRTNVVIDVCFYDRTTQLATIGTLTNPILLADALEEAYVCGVVSYMVRDDAFMAQAQLYRGYFNDTLETIRRGSVSIPGKVIPGPTTLAA
jgi:hypothetical protein